MTRTARWTALAALVLLAGCQKTTPQDATAAAPAATAAATAPADAKEDLFIGVTPAAGEAPASITPIVRFQSIDATKEFLERTLGQSKYETPDSAQYELAGCNVNVGFADNKAVTSISIDLKPGCSFDASELARSDQPVIVNGPMAFARFEELFGSARYTSPCLTMCGNAFDPYVAAVVPGYSANGGVDVSAQSLFIEDAAGEAMNAWREQLKAKLGEDYVIETKFNCEDTHNDIPRAAFAQVPVETLQFGRDLADGNCR